MAINATAVWRVRPSGSNTNGGGYDCAIASAATGTHGSWSTTAGVTTFTDATALAFTSAMVGRSVNISGVGQFSVLTYVSTSQITIQTPDPAASNFGSLANWTVGAGTDYSQQDAPQASFPVVTNGLTCLGGTTLTDGDARGLFTSLMVGNAIHITAGTNFVAGMYFVTAFTDTNDVVLDRTPTTTLAAPATPSLTAQAGGSLAAGTVYVKTTYVNAYGETIASAQASVSVTANQEVVVASPAAEGNATGYNVYASSSSGGEVLQTATPVAIGTNFTITSLTTGTASPPLTNSAGQAATAGVGYLGGGWADFWTNTANASAYIAVGNWIYILGGASPSYTAPDYSAPLFTSYGGTWVNASTVTYDRDPATPTANGYGGRPLIKATAGNLFYNSALNYSLTLKSLWIFATTNTSTGLLAIQDAFLYNCVLDQNGYDVSIFGTYASAGTMIRCEVFSSAAKVGTNANPAIRIANNQDTVIIGCNIHDCVGAVAVGSTYGSGFAVIGNVFAKNGGAAITSTNGLNAAYRRLREIIGNTFDGNAGSAVVLDNPIIHNVMNNMITNHTTAGTYGIQTTVATNADLYKFFVDYNTFYNNTTNYSGISPGAHDTQLTTDPYVGAATENYTLA